MFYLSKILKIIFIIFSFSAFAGDSSMRMKQAGSGLVLQQREEIAMVSQEVYVSAGLIEVNYIFLNRSKYDVTVTVTFPLPPRPASRGGLPVHEEDVDDGDDFVGLETWVGGKEIRTAFRTERVTAFSSNYHDEDAIRTICYWEQTFPAGKRVYVRHRYRPVIGTGVSLPPLDLLKMADEVYCPDAAFKASVHYKATYERYDFASYDDISYILTNGRNWAGGTIRNFRLVVDKGSPDALVTFCGTDIKKISPTKFEFRAANFRPRRDINVFILRDWSRQKRG